MVVLWHRRISVRKNVYIAGILGSFYSSCNNNNFGFNITAIPLFFNEVPATTNASTVKWDELSDSLLM